MKPGHALPRLFHAHNPVPALHVWPGDHVEERPDGTVTVHRTLGPIASRLLRDAEARGDLRPVPTPIPEG